jgi:hypothetical protein
MLVIGSRQQTVRFVDAFEHGMYQLGYVDGRTIVFEHRFANGKAELLADLAAEMVRLNLDVIVTGSNQQTIVAKRVTQAVPIVAMFLSEAAPTPPVRLPNGQLVGQPRSSRKPSKRLRPRSAEPSCPIMQSSIVVRCSAATRGPNLGRVCQHLRSRRCVRRSARR